MPRIIKKMTNFWKIILGSGQCQKCLDGGSWVSLALLKWHRNYYLFYFGSFTEFDVMSEERPELSTKWWTFGDLAKANMKIFRICVWIWICVSNVCLNNKSWKFSIFEKFFIKNNFVIIKSAVRHIDGFIKMFIRYDDNTVKCTSIILGMVYSRHPSEPDNSRTSSWKLILSFL